VGLGILSTPQTPHLKRVALSDLPSTLVIELKRFRNNGTKVTTPVDIPEVLDMGPLMSLPGYSQPCQFSLASVLSIVGRTVHHGHYTARVKDPDGCVLNYNDHVVGSVYYFSAQQQQWTLCTTPAVLLSML
jgi:ubiquitin C-terminal hydrolase